MRMGKRLKAKGERLYSAGNSSVLILDSWLLTLNSFSQ